MIHCEHSLIRIYLHL